jgi:hypothetical protein
MGWSSKGMVGGCFTDVVRGSTNYHQEDATEPRRLPKDVLAAWVAVVLRCDAVSKSYVIDLYTECQTEAVGGLWHNEGIFVSS